MEAFKTSRLWFINVLISPGAKHVSHGFWHNKYLIFLMKRQLHGINTSFIVSNGNAPPNATSDCVEDGNKDIVLLDESGIVLDDDMEESKDLEDGDTTITTTTVG